MKPKFICVTATLALSLALTPTAASGWGTSVHPAICEIAYQLLTGDAKEFVADVRRDGTNAGLLSAGSFSQSCNWPDGVRKKKSSGNYREGFHLSTYEYHFVNVQEDFADALDPDRDCLAFDCAPIAIIRYTTYLARPAGGEREKRRKASALRFLGHFVADLHQPLHAGHASDWGGNQISVHWKNSNSRSKLHSLWDTRLPQQAGIRQDQAVTLAEGITQVQQEAWQDSDVWQWAIESYEVSKTHAYVDFEGERLRTGDRLDDRYINRAKPVVRERVLMGAVRLAHLLNILAEGRNPFADLAGP